MDKPLAEITDADAQDFSFLDCYTFSNPGSPIRETDLVHAIRFTHANYAHIGRLLNRRRQAVYDAINTNAVVREIFLEVRQTMLDDLESGIFVSAMEGHKDDRRFVLSTIGKDRGYTTKQQIAGNNDGPIQISNYDLSKLSDEELEQLDTILASAGSRADGEASEEG